MKLHDILDLTLPFVNGLYEFSNKEIIKLFSNKGIEIECFSFDEKELFPEQSQQYAPYPTLICLKDSKLSSRVNRDEVEKLYWI